MTLQHDLTKHLDDAEHFTIAGQTIKVGIMRIPDDFILAIMVIDGIVSKTEALWLGEQVKADFLTWIRTADPGTPDSMVTAEVRAGDQWRLGVYTYHRTLEDASMVTAFLNQYAALTMMVSPGTPVVQ